MKCGHCGDLYSKYECDICDTCPTDECEECHKEIQHGEVPLLTDGKAGNVSNYVQNKQYHGDNAIETW